MKDTPEAEITRRRPVLGHRVARAYPFAVLGRQVTPEDRGHKCYRPASRHGRACS
jgi:hypothetical protein